MAGFQRLSDSDKLSQRQNNGLVDKMKTPWSDLVKHGVAAATLIVGCISGLIVLGIMGLVVLIVKFLVFIK